MNISIKDVKRGYIAGALRDEVHIYLQNCSKMIKTAEQVRRLGYAVYIPCLDLLQGLVGGDLEFNEYFQNSLAFLKVCDFMVVCDGWERSEGTRFEIKTAQELGIPIFYSIRELKKHIKP